MKYLIALLLLISTIYAVTPVKIMEFKEDKTTQNIYTASIDDNGLYKSSVTLLKGDTTNSSVDIEITNLYNELTRKFNIPPKYNNNVLSGVYIGFTNNDDTPAFYYKNSIPPRTAVLLDDDLNEIISISGQTGASIDCFIVNNSTFLRTEVWGSDGLKITTYYKLRNDVSPVISQTPLSSSNMDLSFLQNGNIAEITNVESNSELNIYNYNGRIIYSTPLKDKKCSVKLPALAAGVYIGRVEGAVGAVRTTPFIKN